MKYNRSNTIITKSQDNSIVDDFVEILEKKAVQSRRVDNSLFDQINQIMNNANHSKYSSVEDKVKEMQQRSGFTDFIRQSNQSEENKKTASNELEPSIFKKFPYLKDGISKLIVGTHGNKDVLQLVDRLKATYPDIEEKTWEEPSLLEYINNLNIQEKKKYPDTQRDGREVMYLQEPLPEENIDPANTDAFSSLAPSSK